MASFQQVTVMGHLGKNPEMKEVGQHKAVKFSLAVTKKRKDKDHTEWFNVVAWNKTAELCQKYLQKGDQVLVVGELETREYEDKQGQKQRWTDLNISNVQFVKTKGLEEKKDQPVSSGNDWRGISPDDLPF
jgi:single-strand DNA-binding protein